MKILDHHIGRSSKGQPIPLATLLGRRDECAALMQWKEAAWSGRGQAVVISGEAGIGKSRLIAWLSDQPVEGAYRTFSYQCSRHHSDSPLYPFAAELNDAACIEQADSAETKLEKLERFLESRVPDLSGSIPIIAELLAIPVGTRYPPPDPQALGPRNKTFETLLDVLSADARKTPVLVLFEDAQWTDATSRELLGRLIERIRDLRVLLVITSRPDFLLRFPNLPNLNAIVLERLDDTKIRAMVARIARDAPLSRNVVDSIVAKSDGVPLFAEELTKSFLDTKPRTPQLQGDRWSESPVYLAIPETLQDTLMAKLDRLGDVKEVAQIGATIGRSFEHSLVASVSNLRSEELALAFEKLETAGVVSRRGLFGGAVYTFSHALIQDAAYASLLQSSRESIHEAIAGAMIATMPSIAVSEPETIAYHLSVASKSSESVEWWSKAGENAFRRSAYEEAVSHYKQAVSQQALCGDAFGLLARMRLRVVLGQALVSARGFADPETIASFEEALSLAGSIEDVTQRFATYYGLWMGSISGGTSESMRFWAQNFLGLAENTPDAPELSIGHRMLGATALVAGAYASARSHLETAVARCHPDPDLTIAMRYQVLQSPMAKINLAMTLAPLGERSLALRLADESVAEAVAAKHLPSIAFAMGHRFTFDAISADLPRCEQSVGEMETFYKTFRVPVWKAWIDMFSGWTAFQRGEHESGLASTRAGLAVFGGQGLGRFLPLCWLMFVQAKAFSDLDAAVALLDERMTSLAKAGEHWFDAELFRNRGELQKRKHKFTAARLDIERALAVARQQGAKAFELRAIVSLANLYAVTDQEDKAVMLLTDTARGVYDEALPEAAAIRSMVAGISLR